MNITDDPTRIDSSCIEVVEDTDNVIGKYIEVYENSTLGYFWPESNGPITYFICRESSTHKILRVVEIANIIRYELDTGNFSPEQLYYIDVNKGISFGDFHKDTEYYIYQNEQELAIGKLK